MRVDAAPWMLSQARLVRQLRTSRMTKEIGATVRSLTNFHKPGGEPNVFIFSTPRSGSTWLMEVLWTQPGFKYCNEPLNLRNWQVRRGLRVRRWEDLFRSDSEAILDRYFRDYYEGRNHLKDPRPFGKYYRPLTQRMIFKEIHAGQDRINWFRDNHHGKIVYLLRHPIAVSLSRDVYPTTRALLESEYAKNLTNAQIQFARRTFDEGSKLEQGIVSWCLHNVVPIKRATNDWIWITYEQLVVEPEAMVTYLASRLGLTDPDRVLKALKVPSQSTVWADGTERTDSETRSIFTNRNYEARLQLVDKWRKRVSDTEERRVMDILARFDIDVYQPGQALATNRAWVTLNESAG